MTLDIPSMVDALQETGVYEKVTILDPATITTIAVDLAMTHSPNEYRNWLCLYAMRHGLSANRLAANVMVILGECGEWFPEIARRCSRQIPVGV
jgi:hypothetical protein